jgi:hypothetical protein
MALLDIRPGEGRRVALLLLHSFCNGVSLSVLISAAPSLFLEHFPASALPYCYIASAVVLPAIGYAYMRIATRFSLAQLLAFNLAFLAGGLFLLRCLFLAGFEKLPSAMMITWVDVQLILLGLEFDALSGALFDLRRAKVIFPLIGTGEVIAGILGGLFVPLIAPAVGARNLLWVSLVVLLGAFLILRALNPGGGVTPSGSDVGSGQQRERRRRLSPLAFSLIVTAGLADLASLFGDNIFYTQVSARYATPESMASFIGVYLASVGGIALATRLFITPWIFQRFGVAAGLFAGPAVACVMAVTLSLSMGGIIPISLLVFWSAIGLKFNDDVHRKSNHRTGLFLMLQALPSADRIRTQTLMEGVFGSIVGGIAGGLLLVLNRWSPIAAPCALVLIAAAWAAWALTVRRPYLETVAGSLRRQLVLSDTTQMLDATSRALLRSYLQGGDPALILYAMHCLENSEIESADLHKLLHHALPDIRIEAARMVARRRLSSDLPAIEQRIQTERESRVIAELIHAALAVAPNSGLGIARQHMGSEDVLVRRFALAGVFKQGLAAADAVEALRKLAESPDPAERLAAVRVIEESGSPSMTPLLLERLEDPSGLVRRGAARAGAKFVDPAVSRLLTRLVLDPECQQEAVVSIRSHGPAASRLILEQWQSCARSRFATRGMIRALGQIGCAESQDALWRLLEEPHRPVRGAILETLAAAPAHPGEARAITLRKIFREELADAIQARGLLTAMAREGARTALVLSAVSEDRKSCLRRALDAASMLYPVPSFAMAKPYLLEPPGTRMTMALETVDNVFSLEDRAQLMPAVAEDATKPSPAGEAGSNPRELVRALLLGMPVEESGGLSVFTQWLAAAWMLSLEGTNDDAMESKCWRLLHETGGEDGLLPGLTHEEGVPFLERLAIFNRLQFFAGVAPSSLAQLVRKAGSMEFAAGERLLEMGAAGRSLFVIIRGSVRVHRESTTIATLGVGAIVGEMAVLDPESRSASVTAVEPVTAIELHRDVLFELMRGHFDFARAMMRMLATRLRHVSS